MTQSGFDDSQSIPDLPNRGRLRGLLSWLNVDPMLREIGGCTLGYAGS